MAHGETYPFISPLEWRDLPQEFDAAERSNSIILEKDHPSHCNTCDKPRMRVTYAQVKLRDLVEFCDR